MLVIVDNYNNFMIILLKGYKYNMIENNMVCIT